MLANHLVHGYSKIYFTINFQYFKPPKIPLNPGLQPYLLQDTNPHQHYVQMLNVFHIYCIIMARYRGPIAKYYTLYLLKQKVVGYNLQCLLLPDLLSVDQLLSYYCAAVQQNGYPP